jgi:hypothetical protein
MQGERGLRNLVVSQLLYHEPGGVAIAMGDDDGLNGFNRLIRWIIDGWEICRFA